MPRYYGRTREEIKASSIAKKIISSIQELESFNGDPNLIMDCLSGHILRHPSGNEISILQRIIDHYKE
jgi:hypothetical protein